MKNIVNKIVEWIAETPFRFYFFASILVGLIVISIDFFIPDTERLKGVVVELHGMIFDLVLFGILLSMYEKFRTKRELIRQLHEEVDYYRDWKEEESKHRLRVLIKKLNLQKITKINISNCHLDNVELKEVNFKGSEFEYASFHSSQLDKCVFTETKVKLSIFADALLYNSKFDNATLSECVFSSTFLNNVDFRNSNLEYANFSRAIIGKANFDGANMENINLDEALVSDRNWFETLKDVGVNGIETIEKKYSFAKDTVKYDLDPNRVYFKIILK